MQGDQYRILYAVPKQITTKTSILFSYLAYEREPDDFANANSKGSSMLRSRRGVPPFFKLTLVVLCAFILWSFNHPRSQLNINRSVRDFENLNLRSKTAKKASSSSSSKPYKISDFHKVTAKCTKTSTNVVFLKTHKTGSSTMSNIMLRFADNHNLTVALPLKDHWELGGYPAYIDKRLIDPPLPKYNIIGHHFRFNIENLRGIMPDNTRYITIIRAPMDNVESVFGFFQDQSPFDDWLSEIDANTTALRLHTFYDNPTKFYSKNTDWFFRAKNHMFFDIGNDVSNDDDAYIDAKIQEMANTFTLVLLTDFFDESLIMMKHLLCWDWDDIIYIKFKMRIEEAKTEVDPELGRKIVKWNKADTKLYDYFNKTFWKLVEDYGNNRMESDLETFRAKQKEAENLCIESYQPFKRKPWMVGAKLRPKPSDYCRHLAWSETVYGERLRDKMYESIPGLKTPTEEQDKKRNELFEKVATGALRSD
ncbi:galactose-3-O-sulfotransferase 2-like isoform X2 [Clavelina lepadiformis]|uniref:galactose-3-O-sulfotransferase 2-like isoform X2 n=1 Tax=Clavelina lepadiformis TaxID=159417 RepID=UPI00404256C7